MKNKSALTVAVAAALCLLIFPYVSTNPLQVGGWSGDPFNQGVERAKRDMGNDILTNTNPCSFHGWGLTDGSAMDRKLAANARCQQYFEKYQAQLVGTPCENATTAVCQSIGGGFTKCSVKLEDGSVTAVNDCV